MRKLLTFLFTIFTLAGFSQGITITVGEPVATDADNLDGKDATFFVDTLNDQSIEGEKTLNDTLKINKAILFSDGSIQTMAGNGAVSVSDSLKAGVTDSLLINTNALIVRTTGQVGIGTSTPDASAIFDVTSITQGFLPPRMTNTQRDAIGSPAAGLMVYDNANNKTDFFNGTVWRGFLSAPATSLVVGEIPIATAGHEVEGVSGLTWDNTNNILNATSINSSKSITASGQPIYQFEETDHGGIDDRKWRFQVNAGIFKFETLNDAETVFAPIIEIDRSTGLISFKNGNVNIANNLVIAGTVDGIDIAASINQDVRTTGSPIFAQLNVDNIRLDGNTVSSTDINGDINLSPNGTGNVTVNSVFEVVNGTDGTVGGFFAGNAMIRTNNTGTNDNAVITGHNSFGGNKQLWYLGSTSSSNNDIGLLNRQNGNSIFSTNNTTRLTIQAAGNVILENQIQIKGGTPGAGRVLKSDAIGLATWEANTAGAAGADGAIQFATGGSLNSDVANISFDNSLNVFTLGKTTFGQVAEMGNAIFRNRNVDDFSLKHKLFDDTDIDDLVGFGHNLGGKITIGATLDNTIDFLTGDGVTVPTLKVQILGNGDVTMTNDLTVTGNIQSNFVGGTVVTNNSQKPAQNTSIAIEFDTDISIQGITFNAGTNQTTFTMPFTGFLDATANFHFERVSSGGQVNYWMWFQQDNAGDNVFVNIGYARHKPLASAEHDVSVITLKNIAVNSGDQIRIIQRTDGETTDGVGLLHGAPGFMSPARVVGCALSLELKK